MARALYPGGKEAPPAAAILPDEELLDRLLDRLKATGRVEYRGEFGAEIATFLPIVSWLKQEGHLRDRKVVTYSGMCPYYFFLDEGEVEEKDRKRAWRPLHLRDWPTNTTATATLKPWHRPPDFRGHYGPRARRFAKPTLFIQNKFNVEWHAGPINYLPLIVIRVLIEELQGRFQIVYSRPGISVIETGYADDKNSSCQYPDLSLVKSYPDVLVLEEMAAREGRPYNELKLEILGASHLFFSVQGGAAHILAAFADSYLGILHRKGHEYPHAYQQGPYRYLSNPPPKLLVARDDDQLWQMVERFKRVEVIDGRPVFPANPG